jgi:hypothetical protein
MAIIRLAPGDVLILTQGLVLTVGSAEALEAEEHEEEEPQLTKDDLLVTKAD